jgi:hypothetical protein
VIFLEEDGNIVIKNAAMVALHDVQRAFDGEAERLGLQDEQDIVDMVKEVRADMWNETHALNSLHQASKIINDQGHF